MKHFANFRDCRIKHNEINGGQPLGNTFGFPLRLHLLHFRHQIVAPGEHGTPRSYCLSVGILFEKVAVRIGRVHKFGIDDNLHLHTHTGRILSRKLGWFNLDFLNDNAAVKKFFKVYSFTNYCVRLNVRIAKSWHFLLFRCVTNPKRFGCPNLR